MPITLNTYLQDQSDQIRNTINGATDFRITTNQSQSVTLMSAGPNLDFGKAPNLGALIASGDVGAIELDNTNYFCNLPGSFWSSYTTLAVRPSLFSNGASGIIFYPGYDYNNANYFMQIDMSDLVGAARLNSTSQGSGVEARPWVWRTGTNFLTAEPNLLATLDTLGRLRINETSDPSPMTERLIVRSIGNPASPVEQFNAALGTVVDGMYTGTFTGLVTFVTTAFSGGNTTSGSIVVGPFGIEIQQPSDQRLKTNVTDLDGALAALDLLRPVTFQWVNDDDAVPDQGFLAHELAEVVPQAVSGDKDAVDEDGNIIKQMADYSYLVPLLTASVRELRHEISMVRQSLTA